MTRDSEDFGIVRAFPDPKVDLFKRIAESKKRDQEVAAKDKSQKIQSKQNEKKVLMPNAQPIGVTKNPYGDKANRRDSLDDLPPRPVFKIV